MSRSRQQSPEIDAEKARIVRTIYDAFDLSLRNPDAEFHVTIDALKQDAHALGDPEFVASLEDALAHLEDRSREGSS